MSKPKCAFIGISKQCIIFAEASTERKFFHIVNYYLNIVQHREYNIKANRVDLSFFTFSAAMKVIENGNHIADKIKAW